MDWVVVVMLVVAGMLLLVRLDNGVLWQDEAETALLARQTLRVGYPRASDGRSPIEVPPPYIHGPHEAWIYSPWVPFYLLAGVFAVIGESTASARATFAVFGLLSIYLTWRLARRLTPDRMVRRLSVALLTCSVPFLLHMRQCRYYAPATAVLLGACLSYLALLERPTARRGLMLGMVLSALFHISFGPFIPAFGALILHQMGWGSASSRKCFGIAAILVMALTIPWAVFSYRPAYVGIFSLARAAAHLQYYIRVTNKYVVPLAFMAVSAVAWRLAKRRNPAATVPLPSVSIRWFLMLFVAAQVAFLLIPDQRHMRYLIPVVPLLVVGEAWWLASCWRRSHAIGAILITLALFTNALQSPHVRVPLTDLVGELTHAYRGPMDGVVAYLRAHAAPGQTAKIPYDDRTLLFYTDLAVEPSSAFTQESYPDWVIIRRDWIPPAFFASGYFRRLETAYERIELDAPDTQWQNREDPGSHHFRTVQDAPRVVIYHRRRTS